MSALSSILAGVLLLGLLASVWALERLRWSARQTALIAVLAALGAISRIPFVLLPGFQPATFFIILAGYLLGPWAGLAVGFGVPLLSNFVLGQGPWTLWQMAAWGVCGGSAGWWGKWVGEWRGQQPEASGVGCAPRWFVRCEWPLLAAFGCVWGFLFGAILNLWSWLVYVETHTWATWLATMSFSLWTDTLHAVSNAGFVLLAGPAFARTLRRFF